MPRLEGFRFVDRGSDPNAPASSRSSEPKDSCEERRSVDWYENDKTFIAIDILVYGRREKNKFGEQSAEVGSGDYVAKRLGMYSITFAPGITHNVTGGPVLNRT